MAVRAARLAMVAVRADEHAAALVVDHHLVEIAVGRGAERAGLGPALDAEGMVVEIEALDAGMGRQRVDALLAAGAEELQRRRHVHLRIVEFRDRRGRHDVAAVDHHRIVIGRRHLAEAGDVLVELDLHQPVFGPGVHLARLGLARLELAQRFGLRHLVDDDLARPAAAPRECGGGSG